MFRALFFLTLASIAVQAQDTSRFPYKGTVTDSSSQVGIPYVHIINFTSSKGTVSKLDGRFVVMAEPGDSLVFKSIGFAPVSIIISQNSDRNNLNITMTETTVELEPLTVFAYRDYQSLKKHMLEMDVPIQNEKIDLKIPPQAASPGVNGGGFVVEGALTGLINASGLNKDYTDKKLYKEAVETQKKYEEIARRYNEKLVKYWTDLPDDQIKTFMEFCSLKEDFILNSDEYQLIVAVHKCLTEFNSLPEE